MEPKFASFAPARTRFISRNTLNSLCGFALSGSLTLRPLLDSAGFSSCMNPVCLFSMLFDTLAPLVMIRRANILLFARRVLYRPPECGVI